MRRPWRPDGRNPLHLALVCTWRGTPSPCGDVDAVTEPLMGLGSIFLRRAAENP